MDDLTAIKMVLAGNEDAFEVLVREYGIGILRFAKRMLSDADMAQDAVQETFLRVYSNLARYDSRYPFKTWLYKIASNLCLDALRKRRASSSELSLDTLEERAGEVVSAGSGSDPAHEAERKEMARVIRSAVDELPPEYKLLVVMSHFEGMKNNEIAQATGLSSSLVKNRLFRARQMLRAKLSAGYYIRNTRACDGQVRSETR